MAAFRYSICAGEEKIHQQGLSSLLHLVRVGKGGVVGIDNILVTENEVPLALYLSLSVLEELCEFVGVSLFIYAVLVYLAENYDIAVRLQK